jgi:DNA-binding transcriptional MocR family regulator
MQIVRQRIDRRVLTPGARLPSVRAMAASTGFSKSTVVEAYDRLAADGTIRSRPGSGFYVAAPLAPLALSGLGPSRDREIDPVWMLRQSLAPTDALKPGCGWLPDAWLAQDLFRKSLRHVARDAAIPALMSYGSAAGSEPLRLLIARRLVDQGVDVAPDQILLTDSGTHAIDLVLRFLLEPGDTVLLDDPCYFNFQALLRAHRVNVVGVPMTPTGPDLAAFAQALTDHKPRLYLTNSAIHNPTGATLSAPTAFRVLKLAEAHDVVIVEDDIMADFEEEVAPRYAAFDGLDRVIRVGSFSKSLSSGLRLGYIAAQPDWVADMTDLRIATGLSGGPVATELVRLALSDGSFRRHMEKTRGRLAQARHRALGRLRAIGIEPWLEPGAGFFIWARLPGGVDAADVARRGLAENVIYAPGNVFSISQSASDYMRFNAAMLEDPVYDHLARTLEAAR